MDLYEKLLSKENAVSIVGLGYVGIPLAAAFSKIFRIIGFDINEKKIKSYKNGIDVTNEIGNSELTQCDIEFTNDISRLSEAKLHIIAVPTPISTDQLPDLSILKDTCNNIGKHLTKGSVVIFESTVFPGATEDVCIPVLEEQSGLKCGYDFKVGYSPERINPGDKKYKLQNIVKIVAGIDNETTELISKIYSLIIQAGVYKAESIKIAEAAKVVENCQRDINIAFVNEVAIICNKLGIETKSVLDAAATKWNFLNFYPGLVGGHCVGVDPYYLIYVAEKLGYSSKILPAGRTINNYMSNYIVDNLIVKLKSNKININNSSVAILGFTFKENVNDIRNTKVADMVALLKEQGVNVRVSDSVANALDVKNEYGIELDSLNDIKNVDIVVIAVAHDRYKILTKQRLSQMYKQNQKKILLDIKGILKRDEFEDFDVWRL